MAQDQGSASFLPSAHHFRRLRRGGTARTTYGSLKFWRSWEKGRSVQIPPTQQGEDHQRTVKRPTKLKKCTQEHKVVVVP